MTGIVEILLLVLLVVLIPLIILQLMGIIEAVRWRIAAKWRLFGSNLAGEIREQEATVATTVGKHVVVGEGSLVYVLGYDLKLFRERQYDELYKLLSRWLGRGGHIIYFLHVAPQPDDIAKIEEVFAVPSSHMAASVRGSIRLVVIEKNVETKEILEKSKTNHFLLVDSHQKFTGNGRGRYQLWLEGYHPTDKTEASNCVYLANAGIDSRLRPVRYAIDIFSRIGNHRTQLVLGNAPELHKLKFE